MSPTVKDRFHARWDLLFADLSAPPQGPRMRPALWIGVPLILLIGITVLVRITHLDEGIQNAIYRSGGDSWSIGNHPFWAALYRYGTAPAAIVVLISLTGLALGFSRDKFRRWRRVFLFAILLAITGPGVITNGLLKEYWGRPRPRHVEGLGGHQKFEPILTIDRTSKGKSFPCGHATMGFYFLGGFFLLRRHRRSLAEKFLWFGLIFGGLIGVARIVQGGHFFSDVVWAAAVCYFTAMGLYFLLRIDRGLTFAPSGGKRMSTAARAGITLAGLVFLSGILVATPYRDERHFPLLNDYAREGDLRIHLTLMVGESALVPAETFLVKGKAYGHGVPTSQVAVNYLEYDLEDMTYVIFKERISGWFSEVDEQLDVSIPWMRTSELWLETEDARVSITLPDEEPDTMIRIMRGGGTVHLETGGLPLSLDGDRESDGLRLVIDDEFSGTLLIDNEIVFPR